METSKFAPPIFLKLFDSQIIRILLYTSEVWCDKQREIEMIRLFSLKKVSKF